MRNPFVAGTLASGRQFAGREAEVQRVARAFSEAGSKLVVYGDSRMGKSSALERGAEQARQQGAPVAIANLASAGDPADAAQRVLAAVQRALGGNARALTEQIARSLNLSLELLPPPGAGGQPTLKLRLGPARPESAVRLLPEVLDAIDAQLSAGGLTMGLGLDEFQRALEWGGDAAEWALRESLQRHGAIGYVLAGSRRGLVEAMVTDPHRAFWKLGDVLPFGPIPSDQLAAWITDQAARTMVTIPLEASRLIVLLTAGRTRDVVQLARAVWFDVYTRGATDPYLLVQEAFERTVREQGALYDLLWQKLDARERAVLRAFAADPAIQIMAAESSRRFGLGPKSTVYSAVERLVEAEHLVRPAPGTYTFDDPFFRRYVQVHVLPEGAESPPLLPPRENGRTAVPARVTAAVGSGPTNRFPGVPSARQVRGGTGW